MKYQLKENTIIKPDGKVVANIEGGEIKPTAPVYYKFMDEFKLLLNYQEGTTIEPNRDETPEASDEGISAEIDEETSEDLADEQLDHDQVAEMIEKDNSGEPKRTPELGDRTPGYPTWLHKTNPEQAAKQYNGRIVPEYEEALKG